MNMLADDELGLILRRITDPADRKSISEVCNGGSDAIFTPSSRRESSPLIRQIYPRHLDLEHSSSVTDQALEAIRSSSCPISVLNLGLSYITDAGLRVLADGYCSKTIKQLNLVGCSDVTSAGLSHLHKMCVLEELGLGYCCILPDVGAEALSAIRTLKKLNLVAQRFEDEPPMIGIAKNCINLEVLHLFYSEVTRDDIRTLFGHKCLQSLILVGCWHLSIDGSDFENLAIECPSLKSIMIEETWRERLLQEMQGSTVSRFMQFV